MARKSRKRQAAGILDTHERRAKGCRFGIYARTSHLYDDEQSSIENQLNIVKAALDTMPDAIVAQVYVDNGFTGTTQERDAFQSMLDDARDGKIDGVAAKDASRLGRNYIEVQTLITQTLPELGVRLVLVSDGIDTKDEKSLHGIAMDIKSLLNDLYSRDLSRKIHGTFDAARKSAPLILGNIPYGYMRDPCDKHHLLPDPVTAPAVRDMFRMRAQGVSCSAISDYLNATGAITAGKAKYARAGLEAPQRDAKQWHRHCVQRILQNPVYKGVLVMNRWSQSLFEGIPHTKNSEEEWIVIEDAHEALVTPEVFDALEEKRLERWDERKQVLEKTRKVRESCEDRLNGKIRCGICDLPMTMRRWVKGDVLNSAEYQCVGIDRMRGAERHAISLPFLELISMDVIRMQVMAGLDYDALVGRLTDSGDIGRKLGAIDERIQRSEERIDSLAEMRAQAYEEHTAGKIGRRDFNVFKRKLRESYESESAVLADARKQRKNFEGLIEPDAQLQKVAEKIGELDAFSAELADMAIESITVQEDGSLDFALKFEDVYARTARLLKEVEG